MRLAHRLAILFALGHIALVAALLFIPFLAPIAGLGGASLYLPLLPVMYLGLPVLGHSESFGWGFPSGLGLLLVVTFWSLVWLLAGYAAESVVHRRRRAQASPHA